MKKERPLNGVEPEKSEEDQHREQLGPRVAGKPIAPIGGAEVFAGTKAKVELLNKIFHPLEKLNAHSTLGPDGLLDNCRDAGRSP